MAIGTFRDRRTKGIFEGGSPKGVSTTLAQQALRKLRLLDLASNLNDLRSPPGNRLEALVGDRVGHHSIRVNDQFRICFRWDEACRCAHDVELTDYH